MSERAAIESLIRTAYEARYRGDLDALMDHYHPDASYRLAGLAQPDAMFVQPRGREAVRAQMDGLIKAFVFSNVREHALTVDGDSATLHWSADVLCVPTGRSHSFEILDLFTIADGKVKTLVQFTDAGAVARLMAP